MLTLLLIALAAEPPEWKDEGSRHGIPIEGRVVPGSKFSEFRAQMEIAGDLNALCDGVFLWASSAGNSPEVSKRTVLEDRGDVRVVHDELKTPIVSDRAVTFRLTKNRPSATLCTLEAHVDNEKAPKIPESFVRITKMDTSWRFEPGTNGKTKVTFAIFVDPAGSVPPFLTYGAQRNAAADTLKAALEKVSAAK
jgi:hypothetical protein